MLTSHDLRQRFSATRLPDDPLDVVLPMGSDKWPPGMRERLTTALKPAGVLIPVIDRHGADLSLLLTQRSAELNTHAGQVSFPGGRMEEGDPDIAATALRETEEEVGIVPSGVSIVGFLDPMPTITGYAVTPIIGLIEGGYQLKIDRTEVEDAFEVPLGFLMDPANRKLVDRDYQDARFQMLEYHYEGQRIWGATAFIIEMFIKQLLKQ